MSYNYTVETLLLAAGRQPASTPVAAAAADGSGSAPHTDHIVELQLVVAALNRLQNNHYQNVPNWQTNLVNFFDGVENVQHLTVDSNLKKHATIKQVVAGNTLSTEEQFWLDQLNAKWKAIRDRVPGLFGEFRDSLDYLIESQYGVVSGLANWPFHR